MISMWHNPRCSKSREALAYLKQNNINPTIRFYMENPPKIYELKKVISLLNIKTFGLIRTKEKEFKALSQHIVNNEELLIEALANCPKLIERPIIFKGEKAVIGRAISKIDDLLTD